MESDPTPHKAPDSRSPEEVALSRFEDLLNKHHDEIFRYIWRLLYSGGSSPATEAEDVTQEVFIRAYSAYDRLRPDSNVRAWLYKIATHCSYDALKRGARGPASADLAASQSGDGLEAGLIHAEEMSELREAIAALPDKQRTALVLRYLDELTYADIADILDCSLESARANVSHALRTLRWQRGLSGRHNRDREETLKPFQAGR